MKKYRIISFAISLLLTCLDLQAQNPYIYHYTTFDGLPTNNINNVFQDSHKFIWFATDAGAVRYDGSTFFTFTKKEGLNTSKIIKIKEDSSGRIWIINWDGSLNLYFTDKIYNSKNAPFLDSLLPSEPFHDFFEDDDKTIYFYNVMYEIFALDSNNHVRKMEKVYEHLVENLRNRDGSKVTGRVNPLMAGSLSEFYLYNLYMIRKSAAGDYLLWSKLGFYKVKELFKDPVLLQVVYPAYIRASCAVDSIFHIIGYNGFILKYTDEKVSESIKLPFSINYTMSRQNALQVDEAGNYWIGTFDDGLYCLKEDTVLYQPPASPNVPLMRSGKILQHLDIQQVNGIIQDHEGNIWISSAIEGVYKISPYLNTHQHYDNKLFNNKGIQEMALGLWNAMWLSNGRAVYLLKADSMYTLGFEEKNTLFNVIYHLKSNKLILGEKYSLFYIINDPEPDRVTRKVNFSSVDTSVLYMSGITINEKEDKINCYNYFNFDIIDPDTLFGEYKSGYWQKDYNVGSRITYTYYNTEDELIINAKKNYILANDTCLPATELSCFDNRIITQHINLNSETELFNIENESIHLFHDHQFYNLTEAFATPSELNISSISYHEPVLYMANSSNVYICNNPLNIINNLPVNLILTDINFKNIHKILVLNDSLYIASDDGLTIIPEATINKIVSQKPIPYIQSILVNDKAVDLSEEGLTFKGRISLKFIFSSISYSSTPVIFSYKLEGADQEWSSGTGKIVTYQKLSFGKYIFKLKAGKPNAAWSEPIELQITIKPRFWQHPAFFVFIAVLSVVIIALFFRRREINRMKHQETDHQLILLEQKALQSMMNPHFIFNTLGSIQNYLLRNKPGEAGIYLSQFAKLIRLNINSLNTPLINLEEEADRLRIYLDLEKFRMENKFDYKIEFGEGVEEEDIIIPSMLIQPYVENSIWHGISPLDGKGEIRIFFSMHSADSLKIIIEDNGIGIKQSANYSSTSETHLHLSMEIIRKRLEIIGKKMRVVTSVEITEAFPDNPNPGTRVTLVVPVSYKT